jgi:acyl-CoA synthetase (AMP-forming)/AMP-acid ligase II
LSTLENGIIGASTVPPDLLNKMKMVLRLKEIIVGYGMTETSLCHTVTTYMDKHKSHRHAYESIGRPIPFSETKIINSKTGHILPLNTDGELCIRGPHVIRAYWDDKEKTAETIKNGW